MNIDLRKGDCLEVMDELDKKLVCTMYREGKSMRSIALLLNTNHKLISRILKSEQIQTRSPLNTRGQKKFDCDIIRLYNNMATHLRFDVSIDWLIRFSDFKKLQLLNTCISKKGDRWDVDTDWYRHYVEKFYHDVNFNTIYSKWVSSGFDTYLKPSIDHIKPVSKGGDNQINNLQFLSWFENRCKNNMSQIEWDNFKLNINKYFI